MTLTLPGLHRCPEAIYYPGKGWKAPLCSTCDADLLAAPQAAPVQADEDVDLALFTPGYDAPRCKTTRTTPAPDGFGTLDLFAPED